MIVFFKKIFFIYWRESTCAHVREWGGGGGWGVGGEGDSPRSRKPDRGLNPRTPEIIT